MASYTRQSSFADGDIIQASDFNDEFNQLVNAFANTTGHAHDGTAAEGPVIGLIGDPGVATPLNKVVVDDTNNQVEFNIDVSGTSTEQFVVKDGLIEPTTTNDIDLGSSTKKFKDLHLAGTANIAGTVTLSGNVLVSGTLGADLIPDADDTRDIGSTSAEWKDLYNFHHPLIQSTFSIFLLISTDRKKATTPLLLQTTPKTLKQFLLP